MAVPFSCYLENPPLFEDFSDSVLFCALAGERGNDFSFLISELQKLIPSHTHRHAHPRTELRKGFITLGTAPPPNFYMAAKKKNYFFGFLVTKKARVTTFFTSHTNTVPKVHQWQLHDGSCILSLSFFGMTPI